MSLPFINPENNDVSFEKPCAGCGLTDSQCGFTLISPFEGKRFDYSKESLDKARHISEDGRLHIIALDDAIQRLTDRREQVRRVVSEHMVYLAPVAQLSDDILLQVFDFSADPWTLSAVCRRWRFVALSAPRLWTKMTLGYVDPELQWEIPSEAWMDRCARRLKLQFQRVGQQPFECRANFRSLRISPTHLVEEVMQELWNNLHRCQHLEVMRTIPDSYPPHDAHLRLPMLKKLVIVSQGSWLDDLHLGENPVLRDTILIGFVLPHPFPTSYSSGLTTLEIHVCATIAPELLELLHNTTRLEKLIIASIQLPRAYANGSEQIPPLMQRFARLLVLREICVQFSTLLLRHRSTIPDPKTVLSVVRLIIAPSLRTIRLRRPNDETLLAVQKLVVQSENPSSVTSVVVLDADAVGCDSIISLISPLRSLEILAIEAPECDYDALSLALQWPHAEEIERLGSTHSTITCPRKMCPRLRQIALFRGLATSKLLRDMVESRALGCTSQGDDAPAKLQFVDFTRLVLTDSLSRSRSLAWLKAMQQAGIVGSDSEIWERLGV